jgi:hypothetical protein
MLGTDSRLGNRVCVYDGHKAWLQSQKIENCVTYICVHADVCVCVCVCVYVCMCVFVCVCMILPLDLDARSVGLTRIHIYVRMYEYVHTTKFLLRGFSSRMRTYVYIHTCI